MHLDEVVITIYGEKRWLWRAVDQDGYVLDEIVQARRGTKAAKRLLTRLLRKQGCRPKRIVTDKLGSYADAKRTVMDLVASRLGSAHVSIRRLVYTTRANLACPSSRMRLRDLTAIATSVTRLASLRDFNVSPMTRL